MARIPTQWHVVLFDVVVEIPGDVLCGTALANLNTDGLATARKLADIMQHEPQRNVRIEGFTASTGPAKYNQWPI